jgi:hypothetical protein
MYTYHIAGLAHVSYRFAVSAESPLHSNVKQRVVEVRVNLCIPSVIYISNTATNVLQHRNSV